MISMVRRYKPDASQLDRCDVCGDKVHRKDLVRTQVEFLNFKSENYLSYSYYDGTYWQKISGAATDAGLISYGPFCDEARTYNAATTDGIAVGGMTLINGVQTWEGNGTIEMTELSPSFNNRGEMVFSCWVGAHMENKDPELTVELGVTDGIQWTYSVRKTWTYKGMKRVWFRDSKQDLEDLGVGGGNYNQRYFIRVTNDGKWWVHGMQLEARYTQDRVGIDSAGIVTQQSEPGEFYNQADVEFPGPYVPTNGTYYSNQTDKASISTRKVCPRCFEPVFKRSEIYGRTDESPVDDPVPEYPQEF